MTNVRTNNSFKVIVNGEQRGGFCEDCGTQVKKGFYMDGERKRVHMICPACGGMGKLIVRLYSIQAPPSPQDTSFKSLWKFIKDTWFCSFLSTYHRQRVEYATNHREATMLGKYRTGKPSPQTIFEAIKEIIKLRIDRR